MSIFELVSWRKFCELPAVPFVKVLYGNHPLVSTKMVKATCGKGDIVQKLTTASSAFSDALNKPFLNRLSVLYSTYRLVPHLQLNTPTLRLPNQLKQIRPPEFAKMQPRLDPGVHLDFISALVDDHTARLHQLPMKNGNIFDLSSRVRISRGPDFNRSKKRHMYCRTFRVYSALRFLGLLRTMFSS